MIDGYLLLVMLARLGMDWDGLGWIGIETESGCNDTGMRALVGAVMQCILILHPLLFGQPNTIGLALYDNPVGQLAWMGEKSIECKFASTFFLFAHVSG